VLVALAEAVEKAESVHERHAQVQDDGVRVELFGFAQAVLRVLRRPDLMPFEAQDSRKGLRHPFIVVDDQESPRASHGLHQHYEAQAVAGAGNAEARKSASSSCSRFIASAVVAKYSTIVPLG